MCMYWEGSALLMVGLDRTGRSSTWSWCPKDSVYTKASIMSSLLSSSHSHRSTDVMMIWTIIRGSIGDIHTGWKPCSCQPFCCGVLYLVAYCLLQDYQTGWVIDVKGEGQIFASLISCKGRLE